MLYNEDVWSRFVDKVENGFRLKTYPQFDPYFNFPKSKNRIRSLVSDATGSKVAKHSFLPFVKIILKTPRYKYQEDPDNTGKDLSAKEREEFYDSEVKERPIAFASHFDTYLYAFYSHAINELYIDFIKKNTFDECVLAYRNDLNGKCNIQFAKEAFDKIRLMSSNGPCTALAIDIKGYFDNIDHGILKDRWCRILNVHELPNDQYKIFRSLTLYSYANKNSILKHFKINLARKKRKKEYWETILDLIPNDLAGEGFKEKMSLLRRYQLITRNKPKKDGIIRGIPQGSSISALLSNVYLIDFDNVIYHKGNEMGFVYRRYCDDILVICPSDKQEDISRLIEKEISRHKLSIQSKKTELIEFKKNSKNIIRAFNRKKIEELDVKVNATNEEKFYKNIQYLGFEFNGQDIYIRPSSLSRYFRKMKGRITKTVMMATGKRSKSEKIFLKQLYHRYTHLGKKNFLNYAYRASRKYYKNAKKEIKEGMNSLSIKRQLAAHFKILRKELHITELQFKSIKGKQSKA